MATFTAYYRVSTAKQGQSGLGLEAQKATAQTFVASRGQIVEEYIEIESGKKNNRPKLAAAIAHAQATGSTLLIAKLDRLARNAGFIFALRDAGVIVRAVAPRTLALCPPLVMTDAEVDRVVDTLAEVTGRLPGEQRSPTRGATR